ncbi:MAG: hypothetical protein V1820_06625 [archaeon]
MESGERAGRSGPPVSILVLLALLVPFLFFLLVLPAGFSYLRVEPSSASVPVSNKSVEFQITIVSEPGESGRVAALSADWPNEGELSWTERRMIVGMRQSTKVLLIPRTPGEFFLTVSLSGEGILPREEYAKVVVFSPEEGAKISSELKDFKSRLSRVSSRIGAIKNSETIALFAETNSSLYFAEQFYSEGKYSLSESVLTVVRENLPDLEARVAEERRGKGFFLIDLPFLPSWAQTVSFDLLVLILILAVMVYAAARAFLF